LQLETFQGQTLAEVIALTRSALGEEAMIVSTRIDETDQGQLVEIVAARAEDIESLREQLDGGAVPSRSGGNRIRPYTIALVGPPGAGKTTTAMKIALHPRALGDRKVGLITFDTYRVGAMDEISTYADIATLPLEIVYNEGDLTAAMRRLGGRDAIVVDTPGRATGAGPDSGDWVQMLKKLQPDEIHIVLPSGLRTDVAEGIAATYAALAPTHLLLSKTDQLPGDLGLAGIPQALSLPIRWLATGQEVPRGLSLAGPKVLSALVSSGGESEWARMVG
jgi:flagellar biosynthesis protein FlhF